MVQIIIYDTNYEEQQFIQKKTREYLNKKDREYEILTIDCVEELFQRRESNQEAVILLDIDMEGLNRNKMAECMRVNTQQNVSMIFITNHAEYVFDAVQYQPFRYIRKHLGQCIFLCDDLTPWAPPRPALAGSRKACVAAFCDTRVIRVTPSRAFAA